MVWDRTNRPVWLRCTVGVVVVVIAAAIRLQFLGILELRVPYLTFYPAVAVAALYGGLGAGLLATVVSAALADYFWLVPVGQFGIANFADLMSMVVFLASCTLISYLAEATYRAQARAKAMEEQARLAVEQELHLFVSEVRDYAIFMLDTAGRVVSWNMGAEQIKGYQADEIIGRPHLCFYTPEDNARGWPGQLLHRAASEGRVQDEGWRVRKDGSRFWADVVVTALHDKEGNLRGYSKVTRDITERKQAEEALGQQREWLRVTLTSIGDAVIATDASGKVTFLNPIAAQMTGWEPGAAEHQPIRNVFRIINEQTRQPARNVVERVLREGNVVNLANHTALITRDGREIPIEDSAAPIRDKEGGVCGVVLVFHDVTEKRGAQEALRASERLYRAIGESIDYGVWVCAPDGRNIYASESFLKLVGITQQECSDFGWGDVLHPEDAERTIAAWKECARTGGTWDIEHRFRGVDGQWHPILARGVSVKDEAGEIVYWAGINLDISARKQIEEELRKSRDQLELRVRERTADLEKVNDELLIEIQERRRADEAVRASEREFRSLADAMPQIVWITRPDGWNIYFNQRWLDYTGQTLEESYGHGWNKPFHPDDQQRAWDAWQNATKNGAVYDLECRLRRADGVYGWWLIRGVPVLDERGTVLKWFGTCTDIDERKRNAEKVEAARQLLYHVLETLPVYVCLLTPDYHVPFANRVFRERFGESTGLRCFEHLFGRSEPCEVCDTYQVLKTHAPHQWEWTGPDDQNYSVFDFPFQDTDGSSLILEMGIDVTERKHAEAELRATIARLELVNAELREFAHVASHDLQEPLRKIQTFCDMAQKRCAPVLDSTGKDYLDRIANSASRMRQLLHDLLDFSRVATRPDPFERVDLIKIVREAADVFEAPAREMGCQIEIENMPAIEADESQMLRLFQNLIGNALKFRGRETPRIKICGKLDGKRMCEIFVEDNGIGFDPRFAELIFKPFQRLHGRSQYDGTGMGLAICRKIVERHGGNIGAESEPGKGSTFIIRLPVKQDRWKAM